MRKQYLWFSLLCAIGTNAFAQNVSQGNLSVTGGFGMQVQNQKQTYNGQAADISYFSNQVDAAFYFADNLAVGMRGTNQVQTVETSSGQSKSVSNIITPYLSYNASLSDNLAIRMSLGFAIGNGYNETDYVTTSSFDQSGFEAKISVPIYDKEYLSVDPFFLYRDSTLTDDEDRKIDVTDTVFGFSMTVYANLLGN